MIFEIPLCDRMIGNYMERFKNNRKAENYFELIAIKKQQQMERSGTRNKIKYSPKFVDGAFKRVIERSRPGILIEKKKQKKTLISKTVKVANDRAVRFIKPDACGSVVYRRKPLS